jgi:hypothetical protein
VRENIRPIPYVLYMNTGGHEKYVGQAAGFCTKSSKFLAWRLTTFFPEILG